MIQAIKRLFRGSRPKHTDTADFLTSGLEALPMDEYHAEVDRRKAALFTRNGVPILEKACVLMIVDGPDESRLFFRAGEQTWKRYPEPYRKGQEPLEVLSTPDIEREIRGCRFVTQFHSRDTQRYNGKFNSDRCGFLVQRAA